MFESLLRQCYTHLIYDEIEEYEERIAFLTEQLIESPHNVILLNNRGIAYSEIGETTEAFADLTEAVRYATADNEIPAFNLADLKKRMSEE